MRRSASCSQATLHTPSSLLRLGTSNAICDVVLVALSYRFHSGEHRERECHSGFVDLELVNVSLVQYGEFEKQHWADDRTVDDRVVQYS